MYGAYRYGFNGKENDNEVKGSGNQQDYGMRIYDPRLGKFLSVDPLTKSYPYYTPYQFSGNTPIMATDKDGGEPDPLSWRLIFWVIKVKLGVSKAENAQLLNNVSSSSTNNYGTIDNSAGAAPIPQQIQSNQVSAKLNTMALAEKTAEYAANSVEFAMTPFMIAMPELALIQAPVQVANGDYAGAALNSAPLGLKYLGRGFKALTSLNTESKALKGFGVAEDFAKLADEAKAAIKSSTQSGANAGIQEGTGTLDGSFSITELGWRGYPSGAPRPTGPFRIIEGEEYLSALKLKNSANAALHREFPSLNGYDFHEWHPVKFGGSPTNIFNKAPLNPSYHSKFTTFWRNVQNTNAPMKKP
jgi:RHS repeat-associated protein